MLSTAWNSQRGSWRYIEKRRGRKDIEMIRRRRGGIERGESKLASNHFPMCSPQSGSLRDVHRVTQRREEGGRRERGGWRIKGGIKRRERDPASNQLPKCSPQLGTHKEIHRVE